MLSNPLVPTGAEALAIWKSLSVEGLSTVVALCCGLRAMSLRFVVDQASPVGGCEIQLGWSQINPGEAVARCV